LEVCARWHVFFSRQHMSYAEAHAHVVKCRPVIRPNLGFVTQLKMLETMVRIKPYFVSELFVQGGDVQKAAQAWNEGKWKDSDDESSAFL